MIVIVYVDDTLFFGKNTAAVKQAKKAFMDMWECRDLSNAQEFLRMKIWHQGKKIFVDQTDYLHKVVEHFGMSNARGAQIPLPGNYVLSESKDQADPDFKQKYQSQ